MKQKVEMLFKLLILIVSGISLYLNMTIAPSKIMFFYFTILSNIFVFLFYLVGFILYLTKRLKNNKIYYIFKGMMTMCITLTLAVYQMVLSDKGMYEGHMLACNFAHLYVPLLVMIDYIIFGEKGNLTKDMPFIWSTSLIVYTIICEIYMALGGTFLGGSEYPYFYMDIDKFGIGGVLLNYLIIYGVFLAYGYLICYLDNLVRRKKRKKHK